MIQPSSEPLRVSVSSGFREPFPGSKYDTTYKARGLLLQLSPRVESHQ